MKLKLASGERTAEVEIIATARDQFSVSIDGADPVSVTLNELRESNLCLTRDQDVLSGRFDIHKDTLTLTKDGKAFAFTLIDDKKRDLAGKGMGAAGGDVVAPMPGKVLDILVKVGDEVEAGQGVIVVEAMKMENLLKAPTAGKVTKIAVAKGDAVEAGVALVHIDTPE